MDEMLAAGGDLITLIQSHLLERPEAAPGREALVPDWAPEVPFEQPPVAAAVLLGLVERPAGYTLLYTERATSLRSHSGQVAFPGGKMDEADRGAAAAALREAGEEVGLLPEDARVLGFMPNYYTGTNYLITPVVALVRPSRPFVANPGEVDEVFEVPIELLTRQASYRTFRLERGGVSHTSWQVDHDGHRIWGITANLTRRFYELALRGKAA